MQGSSAPTTSADERLFHDGFGDRLLVRDPAGKPHRESLLLRTDLSAVPSFEFALNERMSALKDFEHPAFVRVRSVERLPGHLPRVSLLSDYCSSVRLTEVLAAMESRNAPRSLGAPLFLIKEILGAVAVLHRQNADVSHGALAPDRIVFADGKVRIADYVLGAAVEQLRFSPERYWKELRVAVPASAGAARFDKRLDVAQVGMIALALFAGRQLRDDEHMGNLGPALASLTLPPPLHAWLLRTLHMDPRRVYVSAAEAQSELDLAMSEAGVSPSPLELRALGVRPHRVAPVAVRASGLPASVASVSGFTKTDAQPSKKPQQWRADDAASQTMYVPGATMADESSIPSRFGSRMKTIVKLGILGGSLALAFTGAQYVPAPASMFSRTGTLVVESKPQGVPLTVDGQPQGRTPVTLQLATGRHEVELHGTGKPRIFNVFVSRGAHISQFIVMPSRGRSAQPPPAPVAEVPAEPAPGEAAAAEPTPAEVVAAAP